MTEDGHRWRARWARRLDPHLAADRPGEVCAQLGLPAEEEILVFKALRASRRRGYALLAPDAQSNTYLCVPDATVPQLVTAERTA